MTAASTTSLATFQHALKILQRHSNGMLRDPLSALLGIYLARAQMPALGAPNAILSGALQNLLYATFAKHPPFDLGVGPGAYLDALTGVKLPANHGNDWRNAFGTQKGLGSFATVAELQQPAFRHALRDNCPHRGFAAANNEYFCQLSPSGTTACKSQLQHAGEVTKALRCIPVNQQRFSYQLAPVDGPDLEKLVPGPVKIPVLPIIAALYSGAPPHIRRHRALVTDSEFLADLGLPQADAAAILDFAPAAQGNAEIIAMTEPFLLVALRRQLHDDGFFVSLPDLINYHLSLKTRSFVILSGISGTGKSLLPRLYSGKVDVTTLGNLEVVPVRPGWNDLADLIH